MKEGFNDFRNRVIRNGEPKTIEITNSYGSRDYYRYYNKIKLKDKKYVLTEKQFDTIINNIDNLIARKILEGDTIYLPMSMGMMVIRKFPTYVKLENGKLRTNYIIDWYNTLKLWYEDSESKEKKVLVRKETREKLRVCYIKACAFYKNREFFEFKFSRKLVREALHSYDELHRKVLPLKSSLKNFYK